MSGSSRMTRRAALARLGLGLATAYIAPGVTALSTARASTPSGGSGASKGSPASRASRASPASRSSRASQASAASTVSGPSTASPVSAPSGPGTCAPSNLPDGSQMTRRDYERAQQAIQRGDARPLREVLTSVQNNHPGTIIRVGFSDSGKAFHVLTVDRSGAVVSVTVDAGSGAITGAQAC